MDKIVYELENMIPLKMWKVGLSDNKYANIKSILVRFESSIPETAYYYQVWNRHPDGYWDPPIDNFKIGWIVKTKDWLPLSIDERYHMPILCDRYIKYNTILDNLMDDIYDLIVYRWREWNEPPDHTKWRCIVARYRKDKPKFDVLIYDDIKRRWNKLSKYEMSRRQKVKYYQWMPLENI